VESIPTLGKKQLSAGQLLQGINKMTRKNFRVFSERPPLAFPSTNTTGTIWLLPRNVFSLPLKARSLSILRSLSITLAKK